jgi:protein-S-isoprenylcysteine O-methyltransferase Ste14
MYSTYFAFFVSLFLISQNFVIGLCGVAIILMLMTLRLRYEETLLIERFPNDYLRYRETTAKFIPFWSSRMNPGKKRQSPGETIQKSESERSPL